MDKSLNRKINFLTYYAIVSTIAFILFCFFNLKEKNLNIDELTLNRLNIVGEDGNLRMVLSNETRQHPGRVDGKDLPNRERPAGIIFFNNEGDECGGIISYVEKKGSVVNSAMSFTMDNYRNDQVIQLLNDETYENGKVEILRGLLFNEFPAGANMTSHMNKLDELKNIKDPKIKKEKEIELKNTEVMRRRLFIGRNNKNENGLILYDTAGNPKMKIYVDIEGNPVIDVVDKKGNIKNIVKDNL